MTAKDYAVVHGVARCENCEWESDSYKNILAISSKHAKATGHTVKGEVAYAFEY